MNDSEVDYAQHTKTELMAMCKQIGIKGYSGKRKDEIIQLLVNKPFVANANKTLIQVNPKPIVKWIGGKGDLLPTLMPMFPTHMNNYREPFVGGGSVLLATLGRIQSGEITLEGNVYASDINEALIGMYKNIQSQPEALWTETEKWMIPYKSYPKEIQKDFYYEARNAYNAVDKTTLGASALFIFLNKTCFRGLYRTNQDAIFNASFGNYTNPEILNHDHLMEIHRLIQGVVFQVMDFDAAMKERKEGDFVFMDPPYVPVNQTSFVQYNKEGFDKHEILFKRCKSLSVRFMLCNSSTALVENEFKGEEGFQIRHVEAKRRVNSKEPGKTAMEVIITNYY